MTESLLKLDGVGKVYPRAISSSQRFRAFWQVLLRGSAPGGTRVLDGISFEVSRGESLGIIGSNGAGKSTLLKVITGVLAPSSGVITRSGTSAALLELGAGFDPEYSGLENLHMNAAFLGLSRSEVAEKLDDILSFADIGESIHEPVKHYSSGMVVRLGFAVVASVRPDLLITDEVLAVGDESFQKKCIRWIENYLGQGGTLLMVSHNMYQVQKLCRQAIWLEGGGARAEGDVFEVTQAYLAWHERRNAEEVERHRPQDSASLYSVASLSIVTSDEAEPRLAMGEDLVIDFSLRSPDGRPPVALIGVVRADGTPVYGVASDHDDVQLESDDGEHFTGRLVFSDVELLPGGYALRGHAMDPEGLRVHDTIELPFTVSGRSRELGLVRMPHQWKTP